MYATGWAFDYLQVWLTNLPLLEMAFLLLEMMKGDEAGKTEKNISFFLILMAFHFHSIFCANKMDNATKFIKYVNS